MSKDTHTIPAPASTAVMQEKGRKTPLDSDASEDRVKVGRSAMVRNLPSSRLPAKSPRKYRVTYGNATEVIEALDANEAWARFCDSRKSWPSPHGRQVELILAKGESYEDAKRSREPSMLVDAPEIPEHGATGYVREEDIESEQPVKVSKDQPNAQLASEDPAKASEADAKKAEEALRGPQRHAEPEDQPKRVPKK